MIPILWTCLQADIDCRSESEGVRMASPAGWFPDPSTGALRYWDGMAWLDLPAPPAVDTALGGTSLGTPAQPQTPSVDSNLRAGLPPTSTVIAAGGRVRAEGSLQIPGAFLAFDGLHVPSLAVMNGLVPGGVCIRHGETLIGSKPAVFKGRASRLALWVMWWGLLIPPLLILGLAMVLVTGAAQPRVDVPELKFCQLCKAHRKRRNLWALGLFVLAPCSFGLSRFANNANGAAEIAWAVVSVAPFVLMLFGSFLSWLSGTWSRTLNATVTPDGIEVVFGEPDRRALAEIGF